MRTVRLLPFCFLFACGTSSSPPANGDTSPGEGGAGPDATRPQGAAGASSEAGQVDEGDGDTTGLGFLRVQGASVVDATGSPVVLRGVSLGNEVWSNVALPDDHAEVDFERLSDMGANSTRFLMNYVTFEDDATPYVYKDAGWSWIDENVAWAKAHGIYLILNMHVPEGGFQSNGDGGALWSDASDQDRLIALWKAIAGRYADEPAIAGFDLVNEPQPLVNREQWRDLASRIVTAIRSVDAHHIIVVERTNAVAGDYGNDADMNLFTVDDDNVVYEFHFYEPTDYTFQLQPWNNTPDGGSYPDDTKVAGVTEKWLNLGTFNAPKAPAGTSDWTYYEGTRVQVSGPVGDGAADAGDAVVVGKPTLQGQDIGAGSISFDDLSIKEYDASGNLVREVEHIAPVSDAGWYFWTKDGSGSGGTTSSCKTNASCLTISGTADDANYGGYGYYFIPKQGYQYSISGWMKGTELPTGATARMRVDLIGSSTPVRTRNKAGLSDMMAPYLAWGAAHGVPLFLGEFGVYRACFADDKGGLAWVGDVYDLATGDAGAPVSMLSYHEYHEDAFALYYGSGGPVDPGNANQPLIDLLTQKLHTRR